MSTLPSPLDKWLQATLGAAAPDEPRATCAQCAMCQPDTLLEDSARFRPDLKCCTFLPQLANFQVGATLASDDPAGAEGRARIRARIAQGLGATPLGMGGGRAYTERYQESGTSTGPGTGIGRDEALRCPYLSDEGGGRCTIWSHRNSTCATYFCLTDRAIEGQRFWGQTRALLAFLETELALWAAAAAGLPAECLHELLADDGKVLHLSRGELAVHTDGDGRILSTDARRLWGPFAGDKEAFYVACAKLVSERSWESIQAQLSPRLAALQARVQHSLAALRATELPPVLRPAPLELTDLPDGGLRATSWYALRDPVRVEASFPQVLAAFDGRPTPAVLAGLQSQGGIDVDVRRLRRWVDHGLLVPPGQGDAPTTAVAHPVQPEDALAVARWFRGQEVSGALELDEAGRPVYMLRVGPKSAGFHDPGLHRFARMIVARHHGFVAHEAAGWGQTGRSLGWTAARALLDRLLQAGILRRSGDSPSAG